jgi:hypothetical protein
MDNLEAPVTAEMLGSISHLMMALEMQTMPIIYEQWLKHVVLRGMDSRSDQDIRLWAQNELHSGATVQGFYHRVITPSDLVDCTLKAKVVLMNTEVSTTPR